jgi:trehalose/maltose hydrolase-like predicted phosphorylase
LEDDTLKAFTKEAADFKAAEFAKANNVDKSKAMTDLVSELGYDKFLESSPNQLKKVWEKMNGTPEEKKE